MLYIIVGEYRERMAEIDKMLSEIRREGEDIIRFDDNELSAEKLLTASSQTSMFGNRQFFLLQGILDEEGAGEIILKLAPELQKSENIFIIGETKILKEPLAKLKESGAEIKELKKKEAGKRKAYEDEPFNLFLLTDALGERDRKKLWLLFREAVDNGAPIEEIHGLFNWQIKNMILVQTESENPGMHPFVYGKTVKFSKKFKLIELQKMSGELVKIFHERETGIPMELKLEEFVLSL